MYPRAVDPIYLINTNVYFKVQRDKALHKNEIFEQCILLQKGHWAHALGDLKRWAHVMKCLLVCEQGKE